jgi:hypothetical protein
LLLIYGVGGFSTLISVVFGQSMEALQFIIFSAWPFARVQWCVKRRGCLPPEVIV